MDSTWDVRYIASLYWTVATMITVGYGDIVIIYNHIKIIFCHIL